MRWSGVVSPVVSGAGCSAARPFSQGGRPFFPENECTIKIIGGFCEFWKRGPPGCAPKSGSGVSYAMLFRVGCQVCFFAEISPKKFLVKIQK